MTQQNSGPHGATQRICQALCSGECEISIVSGTPEGKGKTGYVHHSQQTPAAIWSAKTLSFSRLCGYQQGRERTFLHGQQTGFKKCKLRRCLTGVDREALETIKRHINRSHDEVKDFQKVIDLAAQGELN